MPALLCAMALGQACGSPVEPPPPPPPPPAPGTIEAQAQLTAAVRDVSYDGKRQRLYLSAPDLNQIQVFDLTAGAFLSPIALPSRPAGIDITADQDTLVIAMPAAGTLQLLPIQNPTSLSASIPVPSLVFANQRPDWVRLLANRHAFVSMTFDGSGFGGTLMEVNLNTRTSTRRTDASVNGVVTQRTPLARSADRQHLVVFIDFSCCPYEASAYTVANDAFTSVRQTVTTAHGVPTAASADSQGTQFLLANEVYTSGLVLAASAPGRDVSVSAIALTGSRLWFRDPAGVIAFDLPGGTVAYSVPIPDPVELIVALPDGKRLAVVSTTKLYIVRGR